MRLMANLIKTKTPFAVIRYRENFIGNKQLSNVVYELIQAKVLDKKPYIQDGKEVIEKYTEITGTKLSPRNERYFKENISLFQKVCETNGDAVWEMFDFRKKTVVKNQEIKF